MRLLILAGTFEARTIIEALAHFEGGEIIASYVAPPRIPPVGGAFRLRVGGFGGEAGFTRFLAQKNITAILDATHPFAQIISTRTARICRAYGLAHLRFLRPPWTQIKGDNWTNIAKIEEARAQIPAHARVLFAAGHQNLQKFGNVGQKIFCRVLSAPKNPFPYAGGEFLTTTVSAFSLKDELALFDQLGITHIVSKNSGGQASYAKIEAARAQSLPIIMLNRPKLAHYVKTATTIDEALKWIKTQATSGA